MLPNSFSSRLFNSSSALNLFPALAAFGVALFLSGCGPDDGPSGASGGDGLGGGVENDAAGAGGSTAAEVGGAGAESGGSNANGSGGETNVVGEGATGGATSTDPLHVLFIGNSFTFYNDLDVWVHDIAAVSLPLIETERLATSGVSLEWHWTNDAPEAIVNGFDAGVPWSHVVLQGLSNEPLNSDGSAAGSDSSFQIHASLLAEAATAMDATPIFYETWAYQSCNPDYPALWGGNPDSMQDGLLAGYTAAAEANDAWLALAGEAWRAVRNEHSEISQDAMYSGDCKHPGLWGTYLNACIFYVLLTGQPVPEGAPAPSDMPADVVETLHAIAFSVQKP